MTPFSWLIIGLIVLVIIGAAALIIYLVYFNCTADKEGGTVCTKNCECKDIGKCALESAATNAQLVCCTVNSTAINGKNYCTGLANGISCVNGTMCASGLCTGGVCVAPAGGGGGSTGATGPAGGVVPPPPSGGGLRGLPCAGTCSDPPGAQCAWPDASPATIQKQELICCTNTIQRGNEVPFYCTSVPSEGGCFTNSMCASGVCTSSVCA